MGTDTIHDAYREARLRLTELATTLTDEQVATPVPALPGWTVKDTFSHLAGLAADMNAGNSEGVATDPWTAKQVADRADHTVAEVIDEWSQEGPPFETLLEQLGRSAPIQVALDIWSHEVDIRSALGTPIPDGGACERFLNRAVRKIGRGWPGEDGVPPLRIVTESDEWVAGGGEAGAAGPAATLTISMFELSRVMLGRRSVAQMTALDWGGADPAPWVAAIPVFGPAEIDVVDSPRA